jgi:hypothetical protein
MSELWTEYEKTLHVKYAVPANARVVAVLLNGTVVTLPPLNQSKGPVRPTKKAILLPPD